MSVARELRIAGKRIGLVPTRGALHEGHLTLASRARELSDAVIVSIYVDPTQDEMPDKLALDLARGAELASTRGVDSIFAPAAEDMFPERFSTYVAVEGLGERLEGTSR